MDNLLASPAPREHRVGSNRFISWRVVLVAWYLVIAGSIGFSAFRNLAFVSSDGFDQPIEVITAARVLKGEMPFRDFDAYYGPLGHYLDAGAVLVQGWTSPTTACERLFFVLSLITLVLLGWWIPRLTGKRAWLLLWGAAFFCLYGPMIGRFSFHSGIELLLLLGTLLLIPVEGDIAVSPGSAIALAALDIVLFAIKVNFGGYAAAAAIFLLLIDVFVFRRRGSVRSLALYCAALLAFGGLFAAAMGISGMLVPYVAVIGDAIRLNYARHASLAVLPSVSLMQCLALLFLFALLCALAVIDPILRRNRAAVYSLALCAGFAHYALFRFDRYHMFFLLFGLFFVLVLALARFDGAPRRRTALVWLAGLGLAMLCFAASPDRVTYSINASLDKYLTKRSAETATAHLSPVPPPTQIGVVRNGVTISLGESRTIDALLSVMNPQDQVFWASKPGSCQSVFDACLNHALYLAMNRLPTTRYWMFDVVTSQYSRFQQQMVREIEARKIRFVGVQENLVHQPLRSNPPESHVFYDFVRAHFNLIGVFDAPDRLERFEVYRLNTP